MPAGPAEALFEFIRTAQVGCAFARFIANDPDHRGVRSIVVRSWASPEELHQVLNALLEGQPQVAAVVFPGVKDPGALVDLLQDIVEADEWRLEILDVGETDLVGVALRWKFPDGLHESWVLGFAPFEYMPPTRRAPHVSLVFKAEPSEQPFLKRPTSDSGLRPIHLADLPFDGDVAQYARTWNGTRKLKAASLNGTFAGAARARVTFTVPQEFGDRLRTFQ